MHDSDICALLVTEECGMTCRKTADPLEKSECWISDRSISIMYRQDGHDGKRWIISPFKWRMQNFISTYHQLPPLTLWFAQSVLCITLPLSVLVSLQPGALSILLWQWNSDDEPCLQGALPQGLPHINKYKYKLCMHTHTHTNVHTENDHLFSYTEYQLYFKWLSSQLFIFRNKISSVTKESLQAANYSF